LTEAIKKKDMNAATEAKSVVEDAQRESTRKREEKGEIWVPRFFELNGEEYKFKHE
jgi:oxysterol-binding protein-related protein 8